MIRLSLILSSGFTSGALLQGSKALFSFIVQEPSPYNVLDAFQNFKDQLSKVGKKIDSICITTDAVRYAIETDNSKLQRVSLYRLSSPEGLDSPTLLDDSIAKKILSIHVLNGARGFDGRVLSAINENEIEKMFKRDGEDTKKPYVVSSLFSILYPDQETTAAVKLESLGAKRVWATSEISNVPGLMDRETTAILSAASSHIIGEMESQARNALSDYVKQEPAIYFGKNDGSMIGSVLAKTHPLETAWAIQGQGIAGVSKSLKLSKCLAIGKLDEEQVWIGASRDYRPIMRQIAYLKNMLVHVRVPILAEFSRSLPEEQKKERFEIISELAETKNVWLATPFGESDRNIRYPFSLKRNKLSEMSVAMNCASGEVSMDGSTCVRDKSGLKKGETSLRKEILQQMVAGGAKKGSIKLSNVEVKPGYNLPEGTLVLSIHASGKS
jgi:hypothetical protein